MRKLILTLCGSVVLTLATTVRQVLIPIECEQTGYYLVVDNDGTVFQKYFGSRLSTPASLLPNDPQKTNKNTDAEAYSAFGNGNTNETALRLIHSDGNMTTLLLYDSHRVLPSQDANIVVTEVVLKDPAYPLQVTLFYTAYQKENILTCRSVIRNDETGSVRLDGLASGYLVLPPGEFFLTHFYGAWSAEMQMKEDKLSQGIKVIDSKKGVRTTQSENPSFIISVSHPAEENCGEAIIGTVAWSGNYKLSFEVDNLNRLHILGGRNDFLSDYPLDPGATFSSPELILAYSDCGTGEASRNLHRWARKYGIQDGTMPRPVVLNSWEGAYFSFDEQTILKMIDDAASMGVELFVLDDGWFGEKYPRNNDKAGLGDWQVNRKKLPGGLKTLIDHAHARGLGFGLWVEPEMVNPKSELAEKHPDWIVGTPNREPILMRNQLLLDLSNPAVQEFVYNTVSGVLRENPGIAYIKWDANRHVENFGSAYLPADRQSHFWIDYIRGLYGVYERLSEEFPDVIFQACSSGGGRADYGALKYHHEFWGSDNTDAYSRIFINWGFSQIFPSMAIGSHVSFSPNHQTKNVSSIKFRFDVAMSQRLGVELQPKLLTPEELEWTRRGIETYKRIRDVVQLGDLYRLISPYDDTDRASMMYVSEDQSKAVLFAYSLRYHYREDYPHVRLQGLDPDKQYRVTELMPAPKPGKTDSTRPAIQCEGETFSGDFLMKYGIKILIRNAGESAVLELTEI